MVDARCTPSPVLWLLDELGRGTHPQEGAKLASEIIEALSARGDRILASTHFPELARMQGVALWRIEGLRDREALDALIGKIATSEELEQALRDAMSYQPERITQAEDAIPRDATLIAKLLGW
jgi:dsDNA-specific endonuclease/ATPase MutS2